jgi:hypothetical protein
MLPNTSINSKILAGSFFPGKNGGNAGIPKRNMYKYQSAAFSASSRFINSAAYAKI